MAKDRQKKEAAPAESLAADIFYWAEALVFALTFLVIVSVFFVRLSGVDGSSMFPTLKDRDQLLVRLVGYQEPVRGDIVVLETPAFEDEPLVKRVIGVAGDVIDIDSATGTVLLNGEALFEPYIAEPIREFGSISYPFTVPKDCAFVMGDNRNHSSDSRVAAVGAIPYDSIIGKVMFRILPIGQIGTVS